MPAVMAGVGGVLLLLLLILGILGGCLLAVLAALWVVGHWYIAEYHAFRDRPVVWVVQKFDALFWVDCSYGLPGYDRVADYYTTEDEARGVELRLFEHNVTTRYRVIPRRVSQIS